MSFSAQVFRVLIASPSDVHEERDIAVRAIQEWNDLNAAERQLVLLPLRWETHSAPEYGKRPQEIINRQVVDYCDLLVGIFWTRVGSPTGTTDSGTIEEIERVATKGKPVMLYFSQSKQDPDKIDLEQLSKLREFKKKTFPKALIETYSSPTEFKDKLSKQIEIQLRSLLAERAEDMLGNESGIAPFTDIVLQFADPETGSNASSEMSLKTQFLDVLNFEKIPDYTDKKVPPVESKLALWHTGVNKDYYRQRVTSLVLRNFFLPLRFWLKNRGGVGARDVYIDLNIQTESGGVFLISKTQLPTSSPSKNNITFMSSKYPVTLDEIAGDCGDSWNTNFEAKALQPQREFSPEYDILIGAKESCDIKISARIFADTLPEPLLQELKLKIEVEKHTIDANDLIADIINDAESVEDAA